MTDFRMNIYINRAGSVAQWLSGKESACNAGDLQDTQFDPWMRRSSGEGNGNLLQYSCMEIFKDRGAKWALKSITTNKASGCDGISVELFQILKDDAVKVLHSICQQIWKTQQ